MSERSALKAAIYAVMVPLARFCLRHGFPFDAFSDVAKRAFVDVGYKEFTIPGRKQSASRVALLTGVHRKEVARVLEDDRDGEPGMSEITSSAAVVAGWRRDKRFLDGRGRPAAIEFEGDETSFSELVRRYCGGDVPPRAVLDELKRVEALTVLKNGKLRLLATAYVPSSTSDERFTIFGTDVADLVAAIDNNLSDNAERSFFQRKVAYDNIPAEALDAILRGIEKDGQSVLEKLDEAISQWDRDATPEVEGTGRHRAMVGIYCYADEIIDPEDQESED